MPTNQPTAIELLEAVAEFLQGEISPSLNDPGTSYRLKVALNALKIVSRQLALSEELAESERALLGKFLKAERDVESLNTALIEKIRGGETDAGDVALLSSLREITLNKLAIDNPKYSTYKKYRPD